MTSIRRQRLNAFSIMELMVAMGIVAVMTAIVIYGLTNGQRSSRDEDRKVIAAKIADSVNNFLRAEGKYPSQADQSFVWQATEVRVGDQIVKLEGYKKYSATMTNAQQTRYFYYHQSREYKVCAMLENNNWYGTGNSTKDCAQLVP